MGDKSSHRPARRLVRRSLGVGGSLGESGSLGVGWSSDIGRQPESVPDAENVLFVPPVDESDIGHQPARRSLRVGGSLGEGGSSDIGRQPESVPDAENVLFVPPVDESDIGHQPASPKLETELATSEGGPDSGEEEHGPAPALEEIRAAIEAILYAAGEPVSIRELKKIFSAADPENVKKSLADLLEIYNVEGRGLQIVQVAGGYQITTRPEYHDRISSMFKFKPPSRLTIQALETLASIAYRQPVTIPEIMELRGVNSVGVVRTLLEKKLVRILGRKNVVGRPLLYGTTKEFLVRFGLKDLSELPRLEDMAEVFGEDVALQLGETFGERNTPPTAAAGSNGGSPEGSESSDMGGPATSPEGAAESETSCLDEGEGA